MPRGMIAAPPFMPPWGMAFPGGMPQMPPMPGGMPKLPNMPPQQPPLPPQAPQQQAPQQQAPQFQEPQFQAPQQPPQQEQPAPQTAQPAPQAQPWGYPAQPYSAQPYAPYGYGAPMAPYAAAAIDPVAAQQLAALQQALGALQSGQAPAPVPAVTEDRPVGGDSAPKERVSQPPVSRVGRPETYSTKGRGIQYSTRF